MSLRTAIHCSSTAAGVNALWMLPQKSAANSCVCTCSDGSGRAGSGAVGRAGKARDAGTMDRSAAGAIGIVERADTFGAVERIGTVTGIGAGEASGATCSGGTMLEVPPVFAARRLERG